MNPLRVVYNVTSNKPPQAPRYHDESQPPSRVDTPDGSSSPLLRGDDEDRPLDPSPETEYSVVPFGLRNAGLSIVKWAKGPNPPRPWRIKPIFPTIQETPIRLLDRYAPKRTHRVALLLAAYFLYILAFVLVQRESSFAGEIPGYGNPARISCAASFWSAGNSCGLDGLNCRPFSNDTLAFRCPASCLKVMALNPHAVGADSIIFKPVVIGGPMNTSDPINSAVYRGDSFICASAIHAGFIDNTQGGCGVVSLVGSHHDYPSSDAHGVLSTAFPSSFPRSFSFISSTKTTCRDLRWALLAVSVLFTSLISLFTTSAPVFFFTIYTALFYHVALASDPPNLANNYELVSLALGKYLPSTFVMFVVYRYCSRQTLTDLTAQIEKTVLWLGACWVGALNNYTFDRIPIQRLTPHDIKQQPGAIPALIIVVLSIFFIALGQAWAIRIEGKMPRYLAVYALLVTSILLLLAVPGMNLRIHHYILGLLLLPGTALQNRPSLLYQGLLVGLFINGIARWGFDSILQTPASMLEDGQLGSLLPTILPPMIHQNLMGMAGVGGTASALFGIAAAAIPNITFTWTPAIPTHLGYDGISILVNDVERFRGYAGEFDEPSPGPETHGERWTYRRPQPDLVWPEFFRFAWMRGTEVGDYTKAGIWDAEGGWTHMEGGPS